MSQAIGQHYGEKTVESTGSLTRQLPYWTIRDGAVVLRDGSYRLGFEVVLPGTEVWDTVQLTACNDRLRTLLATAVPEGECLRMLLEIHSDCGAMLRSFAEGCQSTHEVVRAYHGKRVSALSELHAAGRLVNHRLIFDLSYRPQRHSRRAGGCPWTVRHTGGTRRN